MDATFQTLPNLPIVALEFTEEELRPVRDEIETMKGSFESYDHLGFRHDLVANISKAYYLPESVKAIDDLLLPFAKDMMKQTKLHEFPINSTMKDHISFEEENPVFLPHLWVNYMRKHEFNPVHNHGGILSFVIWIDVPYDIENESATDMSAGSKTPLSGQFEIAYNDILGRMSCLQIPVDKTYRNKGLMFPAELNHSVYPFSTSDEFRISIAGNYYLDTRKTKG